MTTEQLTQLQEMLKETVRTTVNGKIDSISQRLDAYILSDNQWKQSAQPSIELGNNVRGWGKVTAYLFGFAVGLATILTAIYETLKIKNK